jgi:malonyl CoA-acyl carrier protein transacylase
LLADEAGGRAPAPGWLNCLVAAADTGREQCDVTCLSDPQQIKDALVRQAASPVRWVETMQAMASAGCQPCL